MNPTAIFIAAMILLPAVGLVSWAWFAMARLEEDLRLCSAFVRLHFETGPQATENTEGARWPVPGQRRTRS